MIKKMRHIGILVEDFEHAVKRFKGFGLECTEIMKREEYGMDIAFFSIGDTLLEIVRFAPDKGWDPIHKLVRSQKGTINHLCFEVDDLEASVKDFEKNGAKLVQPPQSGAHGRVAFFHPETTDGVLIELCQV